MATTFIDVSLLTGTQFIFSFVLVWIIVYVVLGITKIFESQKHLQGLLAVFIALLTLTSPKVLAVVSLIVPWFAIMFVFITLVMLGIMIFGVKMDDITKYIMDKENPIQNFVIIIAVIILLGGVGAVFFSGTPSANQGTTVLQTNTGTQTVITSSGTTTTGDVGGVGAGALLATLFHPKLLGAIFVLLLGLFTVLLLVK